MKNKLKISIKSMILPIMLLGILLSSSGCSQENVHNKNSNKDTQSQQVRNKDRTLVHSSGISIEERFKLPPGFERTHVEPGSFGHYLRDLPLKPQGEKVHYYDGRVKYKEVQEAVIDIDVGDRDLQQCADAIMRLRAEYLYSQQRYEEIAFHFTNGFLAEYKEWIKGKRISVQGNDVSWVNGGEAGNSYTSFRKYLDMVFAYAGTLSLSQELLPRSIEDMEIGDVFIQGGSPGHAVIIVDMALNQESHEKIFMVAQSYMPAQDIHILKNQENLSINPWYSSNFGDKLHTPEWTFQKDDLMHF